MKETYMAEAESDSGMQRAKKNDKVPLQRRGSHGALEACGLFQLSATTAANK